MREMTLDFAVVTSGYLLAEAPRDDGDGGLWFTDVTGGGVYRWRPGASNGGAHTGAVECVLPKRRGVGGLAVHRDGGVVMSGRDVRHLRPDGEQRVLLEPAEGVTGYNDLCADGEGRVVVGVLRSRPFEEPRESLEPGLFVRIDEPGRATTVVGRVVWPNGVWVEPDGQVLTCDYATGEIRRGDEVIAQTPNGEADGLALDAEGGLWVALGTTPALARLRPSGALDVVVPVPAPLVTSVAFGGEAGDVLWVTTASDGATPGAVLRARAPVPGAPHAHARG